MATKVHVSCIHFISRSLEDATAGVAIMPGGGADSTLAASSTPCDVDDTSTLAVSTTLCDVDDTSNFHDGGYVQY